MMTTNSPGELERLIDLLNRQNATLGKVRSAYLRLEAARKHQEAQLIAYAPGKSQAEKTMHAQTTSEWFIIQDEIAKAEALYEFQKLKFSILEKEWQGTYLECKINESVIKKM